ncbi:hypothetical protein AAU61_19530 [Desulfocarbo indianensis]|nr:hypothetical protein AAU61_19530 [Desulfocarbo indianensis]
MVGQLVILLILTFYRALTMMAVPAWLTLYRAPSVTAVPAWRPDRSPWPTSGAWQPNGPFRIFLLKGSPGPGLDSKSLYLTGESRSVKWVFA